LSREWSVFLAIGIGVFIVNLDGSILNVAFPVLENHFGVHTQILQWVITSYFLVITSILPLVGKVSDIVGRKWVYITGVSIFAAASILCGISRSVEGMILFRIIQGFGGAMIMANAMSIITMVFPESKRGVALGGITSVTAIATIAGPAAGGLLISGFSWRSIFWINVPIGMLSILLTALLLKAPSRKRLELKKIDYTGAVIFAGAMIGTILFVSSGNQWGWISGRSLIVLALSIALWTLFAKWESIRTKPIINVELFQNRLFTFGNISSSISFVILTMPSILLPLYLTNQMTIPVEQIGFMMSAQAFAMILFSPLSGWITDRTNPVVPAALGMVLSILGLFGMSQINATTGKLEMIVSLVLFGAGIGFFQSPANVLTLKDIPEQQTGLAGGIMATMRNLGRVTGTAITILLYTLAGEPHIGQVFFLGIVLSAVNIALIMLCRRNAVKVKGRDEDVSIRSQG
jgi:EmrB/QacA subfamily drug resistance transporter